MQDEMREVQVSAAARVEDLEVQLEEVREEASAQVRQKT